MSIVRRRDVRTDREQRILIALLVSDRFCQEMLPVINPQYLQLEYGKVLFRWIKDYHDKFQEAPKKTIQNIYEVEKDNIRDQSVADMMREFLVVLSQKYEQEDDLNIEWEIDQAIKYLRERSMLVTAELVQSAIVSGKVDQAEEYMAGYRKVRKSLSAWVDPFTAQFAEKVYNAKFMKENDRERADFLFRFPGILGQFLGPFDIGWLVTWMGPLKRGKTWFLWECALQAIYAGHRVVFISLEMKDIGIASRAYKRLLAMSEVAGTFLYPVWDCFYNQDGSCNRRERVNTIRLLLSDGTKPKYDRADRYYRPCSVCRGANIKKEQYTYSPETWYEDVSREQITLPRMVEGARGFKTQWGDKLRLISHPRFAANLSDINHDLDDLEYIDDYVPKVIIIDYANILAPEDDKGQDSEQAVIDTTWKGLGKLCGQRNALVITANHSTRDTLEKKNVKAKDTGRDIRIGQHVDMMPTLNQTAKEKREGVMRIGIAAHRWRDFDEDAHVRVLQQLELGQPAMDSGW